MSWGQARKPTPTPDRPHVRCEPGVRFGQPHVKGISVDRIVEMVVVGEWNSLRDDYGLSRGDVLVACWWWADRGRSRDRAARAWKFWATANFDAMAGGRWDAVPDPPEVER